MTQTIPKGPTEAKKSRPVMLAKVIVPGEALVYERKKLWPQGDRQTVAAQCAYEVQLIETALANAPALEKAEIEEKLKASRENLIEARAAAGGSAVIEALVGDMYLLDAATEYFYDDDGKLDRTMTTEARVEILGLPFGDWEARGVYPSESIPQAGAIWTTLWPEDKFLAHAKELEEGAQEDEEEEEDPQAKGDDDDDPPPSSDDRPGV